MEQYPWLHQCQLKELYEYGIDEVYMNGMYLPELMERSEEWKIGAVVFNHMDMISSIKYFYSKGKEMDAVRRIWKWFGLDIDSFMKWNEEKKRWDQNPEMTQRWERKLQMISKEEMERWWREVVEKEKIGEEYRKCLWNQMEMNWKKINVFWLKKGDFGSLRRRKSVWYSFS